MTLYAQSSARVVAHADPSASNVDNVDLSDDFLDSTPIASRLGARTSHRLRSTTLSRVVQGADASAVLKAIKQQVRANHAFAAISSSAHPSEPPVPLLKSSDASSTTPPAESSSESVEEESVESESERSDGPLAELLASLIEAKRSGDHAAIRDVIQNLRGTGKLQVAGYNRILSVLQETRHSGASLDYLLEIYNEMLARGILPTLRTYTILIMAFTDRDVDVSMTLTKLERRITQRQVMGLSGSSENKADEEKVAKLSSENNMASAFKLFQAAITRTNSKASLSWTVYNVLLRSCANHGNVDAALQIFAHFERRKDVQLSAQPFAHLINTYAKVGDIQGAEQVFEEFKQASQSGKLTWSSRADGRERSSQVAQIGVWNCMIEAYFASGQGDKGLGLLEQMLDSKAGLRFGPTDTPIPSPTTFSSIITGFCRAGDMESALSWYWRLLKDGQPVTDTLAPCSTVPKPTNHAVRTLVMYLVMQGNRVKDINRVWAATMTQDIHVMSTDIRRIVLMSNLQYLENTPVIAQEKGLEMLNFTFQQIMGRRIAPEWTWREFDGMSALVHKLTRLYHRFGGIDAVVSFAEQAGSVARSREENNAAAVKKLGNLLIEAARSVNPSPWTFKQEIGLAYAANSCDAPIDSRSLVDAFLRAKESGEPLPELDSLHSIILLDAALQTARNTDGVYSHSPAVESALDHINDKAFQLARAPTRLRDALNEYIQSVQASQTVSPTLTEAQSVQSTQSTAVDSPSRPSVTIDHTHSNYVDEYRRYDNNLTPVVGYERLLVGVQLGVYPNIPVIGRLINFLGRAGEVDKLKDTYHIAQTVLAQITNKKHQSSSWFLIEDSMIIALAHAGDVEAAHIHRRRMLENGGTPTPDAYGALVQHVTSTTDDAANAMALYQEALSRNVAPNLYLYNTVISKLAKARKADHAIQMFQELKGRGLQPSSVTYGSVIAACCRVGDAESAENLFNEMASQPNFKPRVPPYNTMMQFYTHTKPDRERVLFYYDALRHAGVPPTAHTYKVRASYFFIYFL